jgi:predicted ATPase/DNA-binding XRE family transcriptional regulator
MGAAEPRSFAHLLRSHRIVAGLSQETLAERASVSLAAIGKLERGARRRPYRKTIALLAGALALTVPERLELERAASRRSTSVWSATRGKPPTIKLPVFLSSFIGRERDLHQIARMLETQRLVTLVGPGGIGKTRLAARAAENFIREHATDKDLDAVWFVDLSVITDGEMVPAVISSRVGLDRCRSIDALVAYLRSHRFVLLLDNCEHLLDSVANVIQAILSNCPGAAVLATSRQTLSVEGEHIHRVLPMCIPAVNALTASDALRFDSIRLFRDRAEAIDSRFHFDDGAASAVATICRRVDGIALAIELAAARANAFSVGEIAQQLSERLSCLGGGVRTSASRHRTMHALFDWSYELLNSRERELFRLSSIFVGGFTLDLLKASSTEEQKSDVEDVLATLVDKSLVQYDVHDGPRYRLLEPARQYAREKLRENAEYHKAARSHALALLAVSEEFDSRLEHIPDHVWNASIERNRDNFRVAFEWALTANGSIEIARRLAASRTATWSGFASGEVRKWINTVLQVAAEPMDQGLSAKLALAEARVAVIFGPSLQDVDPDGRVHACRRALALQLPDNRRAVGTAKYWLGVALLDSGRYEEAESTLREARAIARAEGAHNDYDATTTSLGAVRHAMGDILEARAFVVEVLHRSERAGAVRIATVARATLAEIEFASGLIEEALNLNEDAIKYFRDRSHLLGLPHTLCNSAACLVALKRYREARDRAREALWRSVAIGSVRSALWAMQHLAAAAVLNVDASDLAVLRRAAQLLGFIDEATRRRAILRCVTEQREYDEMFDVMQEVFDENALERYIADGKTWAKERALEEALTI